MVQRFKEQLLSILASFDSMNLDDEYQRRVAVKPLYDYFQRLLLEVGNQLCGLYRRSLENCHLEARWTAVKSSLEMIENFAQWDKLVSTIHNARMSSEHNDYLSPSKHALLYVREQAVEFANLVLDIGQKYHRQSQGFTLVQEYAAVSRWYVGQAGKILAQLGENPPFCVKEDSEFLGNENPYRKLKTLANTLDSRSRDIRSIEGLDKEDLRNLIELTRLVERVDASENLLLDQSTCPKCGGNIVETENYVGGPDEEEPHAIFYKIGCDKCDYVLDTETIGL